MKDDLLIQNLLDGKDDFELFVYEIEELLEKLDKDK